MTSAKRILWAVTFALGFLVLRLGYAFFFNGLAGETVLFDLPSQRLFGPFRHITLLGPVSAEGIVRNLEVALPFASALAILGSLSILLTPRLVKRLAERSHNQLLTALALGLSAMPELIQAGIRQLRNRRLRAESKFSVIVPLMEKAVTRSGELALELARSKPAAHSGDLVVRSLTVGELGPIDVTLRPGQKLVISGETGSGKSTLLAAIAGELREHQGRQVAGSITLGGQNISSYGDASKFSYLVHQLPRALGDDLSHGEAFMQLVERGIDRKPAVLLLDEPAGVLDRRNLERLLTRLEEFASSGGIVVIAEHRIESLSDYSFNHRHLASGRLLEGKFAPESVKISRQRPVVGRELAAQIKHLSVGRERLLVTVDDLELVQGECIAITGPNGSGKTTLLETIATERGAILVSGKPLQKPSPTRVALVPDEPAEYFVTASLGEELARADRIAKVATGFTRATFESIVGSAAGLLQTHPLDLSAGKQLALATAMQLSHKPLVLLMDEPVRGLDPRSRELMAETIRCVQETGCAVVMTTHDLHFAGELADRVFEISSQRLRQLAKVSA